MNATVAGLFTFFILCCAYSAQYWAYRSHRELKQINEKIDRLLAEKTP